MLSAIGTKKSPLAEPPSRWPQKGMGGSIAESTGLAGLAAWRWNSTWPASSESRARRMLQNA